MLRRRLGDGLDDDVAAPALRAGEFALLLFPGGLRLRWDSRGWRCLRVLGPLRPVEIPHLGGVLRIRVPVGFIWLLAHNASLLVRDYHLVSLTVDNIR